MNCDLSFFFLLFPGSAGLLKIYAKYNIHDSLVLHAFLDLCTARLPYQREADINQYVI